MTAVRFSETLLRQIELAKRLQIRAGTEPHRFIGIWAVVVEGRVFVRSWSLRPRSWYRTFLLEPVGAIGSRGPQDFRSRRADPGATGSKQQSIAPTSRSTTRRAPSSTLRTLAGRSPATRP
jgi:hypothetical protein